MKPPNTKSEAQAIPEPLVKATILKRDYDLPTGSIYRLAKEGKIPFYRVGPKQTGIRFIASEVLDALRRPVQTNGNGVNGSDGKANDSNL